MTRTTGLLTLIIFTAAFLASGCAQPPARTSVAISEMQRESTGTQTATAHSKALSGEVVTMTLHSPWISSLAA